MSFPNTRVLTSFLREYLLMRQADWNSTTGKLKACVRDDPAQKSATCLGINRKFNEMQPNSVKSWISLAIELGEEARETSLLSETMQAIRSYIIEKLLDSKDTKDDFIKYRDALLNETDNLDKEIFKAIEAKKSRKDVLKLEKHYHDNLLKLSDLGDMKAVATASRARLFSNLQQPDLSNCTPAVSKQLNENIPYYYHEGFYRIYYQLHLRELKKWQCTFDDFEKKSASLPNEIEIDIVKTDNTANSSMFGGLSTLFTKLTKPTSSGLDALTHDDELKSTLS